jgi:translation initiation factor 1
MIRGHRTTKPSPQSTHRPPPLPTARHRLRIHKEKRRGKSVTVVQPFQLDPAEFKTLLTSLKKQLGTGGTLKDNALEFQGDIGDVLRGQLQKRGFGFAS